MEKKTVRAALPIIGGTEDETRAVNKNYRRSLFKSMRARGPLSSIQLMKWGNTLSPLP